MDAGSHAPLDSIIAYAARECRVAHPPTTARTFTALPPWMRNDVTDRIDAALRQQYREVQDTYSPSPAQCHRARA